MSIAFDSFGNSLNRSRAVKVLICVVNYWGLLITDNLTSFRDYIRLLALLKVGKTRVNQGVKLGLEVFKFAFAFV
jgi:hypothetical protein